MDITKDRGFNKQAKSSTRECAMQAWEVHSRREGEGKNVEVMFLKQIPEHRTWLNTVFNVVKYLACNGLPLRGDEEQRGGLYNK